MQEAAIPTATELIAHARSLAPVLAERAPAAEAARRLPEATIADMRAAGFFRVLQPARFGGYECDIATYWDIQLALAAGCMSTAWVYGVVGVHPWLMALMDERAAQDVWGADDTVLISSSLMPAGSVTRVALAGSSLGSCSMNCGNELTTNVAGLDFTPVADAPGSPGISS